MQGQELERDSAVLLKPIKDRAELWRVSVGGGEEARVLEGVFRSNFDVKRRGIYYAAQPDHKETQFLFYDFASMTTKRIATLPNYVGWGFSVSPDAQWILSTQGGNAGGRDLVLVENFR